MVSQITNGIFDFVIFWFQQFFYCFTERALRVRPYGWVFGDLATTIDDGRQVITGGDLRPFWGDSLSQLAVAAAPLPSPVLLI